MHSSKVEKQRRFEAIHYRILALIVVALAMAATGCGGSSMSSMSSTSGPLTAAQAQAVSGQVVQALTVAIGDALGNVSLAEKPHSLATVLANAHPETSSSNDCTSN